MLSQTTEYALRAMACLATSPGSLTATPQLARETRVPANYLAKVLQLLAQADLIQGRRGVGGGYRLARTPEMITLLDIVNAIAPLTREERARLGAEVADTPHLAALHAKIEAATETVSRMFAEVTLAEIAGCGGGAGAAGPAGTSTSAGGPPMADGSPRFGAVCRSPEPAAAVTADGLL